MMPLRYFLLWIVSWLALMFALGFVARHVFGQR
jgi:hypothetical protein